MPKIIGNEIRWFESITSTNEELQNHVSKKYIEKEGAVFATTKQKAGKGLAGNSWESENDKNITISVFLKPQCIQAKDQFFLNMAVSLGVYDFIRAIIQDRPVTVKWPNDIYVVDKKIAGILINHSVSGKDILYSIVGIGVNINQVKFDSKIPNPVSVKQVTGLSYDLTELLDRLLELMDFRYHQLISGQLAGIRSDYIGALLGYFKWMKFRYRDELISARITGVSASGLLQLETHNYRKFECDLKEIEFLI